MRIAVLVHRFPGISTTFILRQLAALLDRGHEVTVYARTGGDSGLEHEEVRAYGLKERTTYIADAPPLDAISWDRSPEFFERGQHDVLDAQMGQTARDFLFAREACRAPFVATFHGFDFSAYPRLQGTDCYQTLFGVADAITHNCEHARACLLKLGCPPQKLSKYTSSIDVDQFPFRERRLASGEQIRVLTVARLTEKKGIEVGLRAIAAARERGADLHYDVVGEGPMREQLEDLIEELSLSEVVRLHGERDGAYVLERLAEAHIFLLASVTASSGDQEGTPVSLMEAQACGLPVLSTLHSGIPEVVAEGESGLLVRESDPDALAAGLEQLLARSAEWPVMGRRGRDHIARNYDLATWTDRLLALYEEAAARFPGG